MKVAFISYRRKDTVDIAGRMFDRLSGYFGPGSALLDVDALVSGANYRTQIERLLERCHVTLAVIGREWLTAVDDSGRRRLDNPDDQLRIEIAVALKSGRRVIPVLVHDATLPAADDLPEDIRGLAQCTPHVLQSGTPFNTDVQLLIERLQEAGMRPPERNFPWQTVLLPAGILLALTPLLSVYWTPQDRNGDYVLQQLKPGATLGELRTLSDLEQAEWDGRPFDSARYDRYLLSVAASVFLPMAAAPMVIVWGKRRCCLSKERTAAQRHYAQGAGRLPTPKSGKSVVCLALGLASFGAGWLTAVPALAVGAAAWRELHARSTWIRGRSLVVVGALASLAGIATSYFVHAPMWRHRSWLVAMESAAGALDAGDAAEADGLLQAAARAGRDDPRLEAASRVRRGDVLLRLKRPDEAIAELTAAIEGVAATWPDHLHMYDTDPGLLGEAYRLRAEAYDAAGRPADAEADRQWHPSQINQPPPGDSPPRPFDDAAPIEAPEAPPPAPAADPAA